MSTSQSYGARPVHVTFQYIPSVRGHDGWWQIDDELTHFTSKPLQNLELLERQSGGPLSLTGSSEHSIFRTKSARCLVAFGSKCRTAPWKNSCRFLPVPVALYMNQLKHSPFFLYHRTLDISQLHGQVIEFDRFVFCLSRSFQVARCGLSVSGDSVDRVDCWALIAQQETQLGYHCSNLAVPSLQILPTKKDPPFIS